MKASLRRRGPAARESTTIPEAPQPAKATTAAPASFRAVRDEGLRAAALRVAESWKELASDNPDRSEVLQQLDSVLAAVEGRPQNRNAREPEQLPTGVQVLRRRLLDRLRAELLRSWAATSPAPDPEHMVATLTALEHVREQLEPRWDEVLANRMAGPDGLSLMVEVAHDLRSPLTSILFLADPLRKGQSGEVNDVQRRQLGIIYSAAFGLLCVMSDVIELAQGGDRLMQTERTPFSVTDVLNSVQDIVQPLAEEKGLSIRVLSLDDDQRLGFATPLSRVLLNLTTNALKFTEDGFVEIVVRATGPETVEFSVRDTGDGLTPEALERLYQPFRREPGRKSAHFSGIGLGLSICRKLVEAMDSRLEVETRPGWGTRFSFELELPPVQP